MTADVEDEALLQPELPGPFRKAARDFTSAIDGLSEFLTALSPQVAALEQPPRMVDLPEVRSLTPRQSMQVADLLRSVAQTMLGVPTEKAASSRASSTNDAADPTADMNEPATADGPNNTRGTESVAQLSIEVVDPTGRRSHIRAEGDRDVARALGATLKFMARRQPVRPKMPILLGAVLALTVAAFETLVGDLAEARYRLHPGAAGTNEKEFSLDDLRKYGSIDEAFTALVHRRVDDLQRKGLVDWAKWLKDQARVDLKALSVDWRQTVEIFERRNLLVHHGSRVSRQYLDNVDFQGDPPALNSELDTDELYVHQALLNIGVLGVSAVTLSWANLVPSECDIACAFAHARIFRLMREGEWREVEHACGVLKQGLRSARANTLMFEVNELLAVKRQGRIGEAQESARKIDLTALDARFRLAVNALLDNDEEAVTAAREGLSAGTVAQTDLADWPLLEELRAKNAFRELVPHSDIGPVERPPRRTRKRRRLGEDSSSNDDTGVG